ncbi:MAG: hypothetical protein A2Y07_06765 [Planctomycetes bacterium GWF2_50_10]|nr:MAG: hypothetical protein A2Y07_06765 [Planctomycetes bacterium GWF2_50_10]
MPSKAILSWIIQSIWTDLAALCQHWLLEDGSRGNDFYERSDANRDGKIDFLDLAELTKKFEPVQR